MTNKDHEYFEFSTKCCICKRKYEEGDVKVKDQYYITGKHQGSAHQECNLILSLTKKDPCCVSEFAKL